MQKLRVLTSKPSFFHVASKRLAAASSFAACLFRSKRRLLLSARQRINQQRTYGKKRRELLIALGFGVSCGMSMSSVAFCGGEDEAEKERLRKVMAVHHIIRKGTLRDLKKLSKTQDIKQRDRHGRSPMMIAAMYNKVAMLRFLLSDTDIGINDKDSHGLTALHYCAHVRGSSPVKVASVLLEAGANPLQEDDYGITPFHKAVAFGQHGIVRLMLKGGVDINTPTGRKNTRLSDTHDEEHQPSMGDTALHLACRTGNDFMTSQLLELGADPVSVNMSGDTPLHDAVRMTYPQVVKALVENGANPKQLNNMSRSPADECSRMDTECIRCLYHIYSRRKTS